MRKTMKAASSVILASLILAACSSTKPAPPPQNPPAAAPEAEKLPNTDWNTFGYDYQQTRHVPLKGFTKDNLKDLGIVWSFDLMKNAEGTPPGNQNFPIIVDGVMYVTTSFNHVFAFDAVSGKQFWHWQPDDIGVFKNFGLTSNRGVAVGDGKVFMLTIDNHVVSLDQKTGKLIKIIDIGDTVPGVTGDAGYYETTAPIFYKGNLYIGSSGADNGVRGFVMAYKSDLTPAWDQPYWTIPPKGQDWLKDNKFQGGGTVWMPVTIDPETDIIYFATGNPAPDFYGEDRPGNNPDTDSVLAIDSKTGKKLWAQQEVSHDLWDYDAASSPMLLTTKVDGKDHKIVVEGGKSGEWWAWDAKTGEVIYKGIPFVKIDHPTPTPEGVLAFPGALGGQNYAPETFDPETNYVLIPAVEQGMVIKSAKNTEDVAINNKTPGAVNFGTTIADAPDVKPTGNYTAIDVNTGKVVYQKPTTMPMRGGFTSVGGSIAFYGDGEGFLHAIDVKTGEDLWKFQLGDSIQAAPSIFTRDGKQYIAITTGGKGSKLYVLALGGDKTQVTGATGSGSDNAHQANPADNASAAKDWLTLDKADKTVNLLLIGGLGSAASGMNFNGYANGDMKVTVPQGWKVNVTVQNANPQIPHSVMITPESVKGTVKDFKEAFKGASTPNPLVGFTGTQSQTFSFTADQSGNYLIWCAVPGHGVSGMYDLFTVDNNAKEPSVSMPDKGTVTAK